MRCSKKSSSFRISRRGKKSLFETENVFPSPSQNRKFGEKRLPITEITKVLFESCDTKVYLCVEGNERVLCGSIEIYYFIFYELLCSRGRKGQYFHYWNEYDKTCIISEKLDQWQFIDPTVFSAKGTNYNNFISSSDDILALLDQYQLWMVSSLRRKFHSVAHTVVTWRGNEIWKMALNRKRTSLPKNGSHAIESRDRSRMTNQKGIQKPDGESIRNASQRSFFPGTGVSHLGFNYCAQGNIKSRLRRNYDTSRRAQMPPNLIITDPNIPQWWGAPLSLESSHMLERAQKEPSDEVTADKEEI